MTNNLEANNAILKNFWLVGISHWNAPVTVREKFSLSKEQTEKLYVAARSVGITSILPVSTCNRTEIYAFAETPEVLIHLLCSLPDEDGNLAEFKQYGYVKNADEALQHFFRVAAGLDSQIAGDAQITGQIRSAYKLSLKKQMLGSLLSRLTELALRAGKKSKSGLRQKTGAASIAQAAVKSAEEKTGLRGKQILLVGLGEIGSLTLKALLRVADPEKITLMNRTGLKAHRMAAAYQTRMAEYESLREEIIHAQVIFVAASAASPIVTNSLLSGVALDEKLFIDLSLPRNIEPDLNAAVLNIDGFTDFEKENKQRFIALAEKFIREAIDEYYEWLSRFEFAQTVKTQIAESIFENGLEQTDGVPSKFIDRITSEYLRHFQKEKQSRNLAA